MYRFKVTVINKAAATISQMDVYAQSLQSAIEKATQQAWWDCYSPKEIDINITGKCRV